MIDGPEIPEEDAIRAAEYALGLMPATERAAFEAEMTEDPVLRAEVRGWDEDLAPIAGEIAPVTPDPATARALEERLFGPERPARRPGFFSRLAFWRGLSLVAVAAAAALAVLLVRDISLPIPGLREAPAPAYVADLSGEGSDLQLTALYDAGAGALRVNRRSGAAPAGRALELWLIEGDNAPVSLGLLPEDRRGEVALPDGLGDRLAGATLAVTDEPPGGSPTGEPTGDVLGTGKVSRL